MGKSVIIILLLILLPPLLFFSFACIVDAGPDKEGGVGEYIRFEGKVLYGGVGIIKYMWDFNDDGKWDYSSVKYPNITFCYSKPGTYKAVFCVVDHLGLHKDFCWVKIEERLLLRIQPTKSVFMSSENITVNVGIINVGKEMIKIWAPTLELWAFGHSLDFLITTPTGERISKSMWLRATSLPPTVCIEPGEEYTTQVNFANWWFVLEGFNIPEKLMEGRWNFSIEGKYTLIGIYDYQPEWPCSFPDHWFGRLVSNTADFTVISS
ncbi:MAG: PKD domain-containing protein [Thermoplasmata archaeon]